MSILLLGLLLFVVNILLIFTYKAYSEVPLHELKRRARNHDAVSRQLYQVTLYSSELWLLHYVLLVLSVASIELILYTHLHVWLALLLSSVLLWVSFIWRPKQPGRLGNILACLLAKPFAIVMRYLHMFIGRLLPHLLIDGSTKQHRLYQIEDLLTLIEQQSNQPDNKISKDRLVTASAALTYGDKTVGQIMTPRRMIVFVSANDIVGPVLMEELHSSGHSRFPVTSGESEEVVGTLYFRDMIDAREGGHIRDIMKKEVYFVHEAHTLERVLQAFLKTKHHLFIVVDGYEDIVGIITIEDVLEQLIGKSIVDEFDQYEDLRAVATQQAKKVHAKKATEVIE